MAHEVETMMYSGEVPWHGLGVYVGDEPVDSRAAIIKAGLNWNVEKRPLFANLGGNMTDVGTHCAVVRSTDNALLGVVGKNFGVVQNSEAFSFMDSLAGEGLIRYHTAGSLRGGRNTWILAKFRQDEVVPGDLVDRYLLLCNAHDGSRLLRGLPTDVRVVCANTQRMALDAGAGEGIAIRHTRNVLARLDEAREVLGFANEQADASLELSQRLVQFPMSEDKWARLLGQIVPANIKAERNTRTDNIRDAIRKLAEEGRGADLVGVHGTGWGALQSVVEYANYYRSTRASDDTARQAGRFESSLFGASADMIATAKNELVQMMAA